MYVCLLFMLTDRALTIPSNICGGQFGTRGLLNRKISEEHLQSSQREHKKHKTRQKRRKERKEKKKMPEKDTVLVVSISRTQRHSRSASIKRMHGDIILLIAYTQHKEGHSRQRVWH